MNSVCLRGLGAGQATEIAGRVHGAAAAEQPTLNARLLEHLRRMLDSADRAEWHRRATTHAAGGFGELAL